MNYGNKWMPNIFLQKNKKKEICEIEKLYIDIL